MSDEKIPTTQSAWRVRRRGHPSKVLQLVHDAPVRADLQAGEVLVRVEAAALNPVGFKLMRQVPDFIAKRPQTSEYDFAGVVIASKSRAHAFGDRVFGAVPIGWQFKEHEGALCQYTRVPEGCLGQLPNHISFVDGAGVAITALTAYHTLINVAKIREGQNVLVYGGSMAKERGCKVWASASGANEALVRSLGADEFLDYTKAPIHQTLTHAPPSPRFDVILDAVGLNEPSLYTHSEAYLASDGVFLSVSFQPTFSLNGLAMALLAAWRIWLQPVWLGGTKRKYKTILLKPKKIDCRCCVGHAQQRFNQAHG